MDKLECSICFESINEFCFDTKCKHKFHYHCLIKWLKVNNNCPCCRDKIDANTDNKINLLQEINNVVLNDINTEIHYLNEYEENFRNIERSKIEYERQLTNITKREKLSINNLDINKQKRDKFLKEKKRLEFNIHIDNNNLQYLNKCIETCKTAIEQYRNKNVRPSECVKTIKRMKLNKEQSIRYRMFLDRMFLVPPISVIN
jgi:hypothetical protein